MGGILERDVLDQRLDLGRAPSLSRAHRGHHGDGSLSRLRRFGGLGFGGRRPIKVKDRRDEAAACPLPIAELARRQIEYISAGGDAAENRQRGE